MILPLLAIALGTLVSEDLTLAASGALAAQGKLTFIQAVVACASGIWAGDMLLYLAGRAAAKWPWAAGLFRRWIPEPTIVRGAGWLDSHGLAVVMMSRFTPGLRLPTYFAAGLLPTSLGAFSLYFLLAAIVWTPLVVGGAGLLTGALARLTPGPVGGVWMLLAIAGAVWLGRTAFRHRRRLVGFLRRKAEWEFWPVWAAYVPLVPYLVYLAVRHRSLTLFTAANPAIPGGGLTGESKYEILRRLALAGAETGSFALLPPGAPVRFAADTQWPLVLKPDIGERGEGVAVVRSEEEARRYLQGRAVATIAQSYHPGEEFGLFYYRYPGEARGCLYSITEKRFPTVTGDGRRSLRELIWSDRRAVCLADTYLRAARRDPDSVPASGETIPLVEIGSHCRGAIFLDGSRYWTEALEQEVDRISRAYPGFYFGRYDVRAASAEELKAGRFRVIELNGAGAEAAHIYDPAVPAVRAYGSLCTQWRIAFEIGAENRKRGFAPMRAGELIRLLRRGH